LETIRKFYIDVYDDNDNAFKTCIRRYVTIFVALEALLTNFALQLNVNNSLSIALKHYYSGC